MRPEVGLQDAFLFVKIENNFRQWTQSPRD